MHQVVALADDDVVVPVALLVSRRDRLSVADLADDLRLAVGADLDLVADKAQFAATPLVIQESRLARRILYLGLISRHDPFIGIGLFERQVLAAVLNTRVPALNAE